MLLLIRYVTMLLHFSSYRIERTVNKSQMKLSLGLAKNSNDHKNIVEAIDSHLRAIECSIAFYI